MKKYFLYSLFFLSTVLASGAEHFALTEGFPAQEAEKSLAYKIAQGKTITYCIAASGKQDIAIQELKTQTEAAFKEWTYGTALYIEKTGRAEEFKKLIPILKNAKMQYQENCDLTKHKPFTDMYPAVKSGDKESDLTIIVSTPYCKDNFQQNSAFYADNFEQNSPFLCMSDEGINIAADKPSPYAETEQEKKYMLHGEQTLIKIANGKYTEQDQDILWETVRLNLYDENLMPYFVIIAHELGHAFGMADQYTTRLQHPLYSTAEIGEGIMRYGYTRMNCDDADGIVAIFGMKAGQKNTFKSFCENGPLIKNGIQKVDKDTPKNYIDTEIGGFKADYLTPKSATKKTFKRQILFNAIASDTTTAMLKELGLSESEIQNTAKVQIFSRGEMDKNSRKTGRWDNIIQLDNAKFEVIEIYDKNGKLKKRARAVPSPEDLAEQLRAIKKDAANTRKKNLF